ncbi:MAG: hypothetical protein ACOYIK_09880, partial [Coriobacteriales bacterium]
FSFKEHAMLVSDSARNINKSLDSYPDVVLRCYSEENLNEIDRLKHAIFQLDDGSNEHKLCWLAFLSILRPASHAGTATWQYLLPNRTKANVIDAFGAFDHQVDMMVEDMLEFSAVCSRKDATLLQHDAREKCSELKNTVDLVVTSPPYANNYDYADATRLELSVLGEISSYGELQTKIRPHLVRSCTQMVGKQAKDTFEFIEDPVLKPIHDELKSKCELMYEEKSKHGGSKNYHTMIALYFLDMANVFISLRETCKSGSRMCWVIGDSAPYGIYVPVDDWVGQLAIAAGFKEYHFEKIRDRNIKWKNRKHRVPLKEGNLWIEG